MGEAADIDKIDVAELQTLLLTSLSQADEESHAERSVAHLKRFVRYGPIPISPETPTYLGVPVTGIFASQC